MRDGERILDEWLALMSDMLYNERYEECAMYSNNIGKTFAHMEFVDGVFMAAVLEGVFLHMRHILTEHDVSDEFSGKVRATIRDGTDAIRQKRHNGGNAWDALKQIRYLATTHSINAVQFPLRKVELWDDDDDFP